MEYTFVAAFTGDCSSRPHLWIQSVTAATEGRARTKFLREVRGGGDRAVSEVARIDGPNHQPIREYPR
jgi:hypothetical protein